MADNSYSMRRTEPGNEMEWVLLINCEGHQYEVEWFETRAMADSAAMTALADAAKEDYTISVYVLQCKSQGHYSESR